MRLTNGFSKKVENLEHTVALHFMHYIRSRQTGSSWLKLLIGNLLVSANLQTNARPKLVLHSIVRRTTGSIAAAIQTTATKSAVALKTKMCGFRRPIRRAKQEPSVVSRHYRTVV